MQVTVSSLKRETELMRLLTAATEHLLSAKDADTLVRGIFSICSEPLGVDTYFNFMVSQSGDALELISCAGIPEDYIPNLRRLSFGEAICGTVALTRKPIVATHIQTSGYDKAALVRSFGIRVYACNPLLSDGRLLGTLSFASHTRDTFEPEELDFFRTVSHYVELRLGRLQLIERLQHHASLLDLVPDPILSLDLDNTIQYWNHGAEETYGWTAAEAVGRRSYDLLKSEYPQDLEQIHRILLERGSWQGDLVHTSKDGKRLTVSSRWALQRDAKGKPVSFLEVTRDITEKKRFEEQLRQTAKLESLGVLAGGIAHDFNNLLVGILGSASLAADSLPLANPARELLTDVVSAAERASMLTRQLLAYAGKGRFQTHRINLSDLVREVTALVQSAIPKNVQVRFELKPDLPAIEADVAQLQQVIMNLVINGAEAIGKDPGTVLITTYVQQVDPQYLATLRLPQEIEPGEYVALEVHDTGCGMDEATIARIFDPFFTTKFQGRGLGLSAVQGIIRGHKGAIKVYSTPGRGTTFKILLPAVAQPAVQLPMDSITEELRGSGTILVADDEPVVRNTARRTLEAYGYSVLVAEDGRRAIELFKRHPEITAVLLDLTMPVMDGEEALRQLRMLRPNVVVVLSSGFNEVEAIRRFTGKGLGGFIQKPYTAQELAAKIKAAVSSSPPTLA